MEPCICSSRDGVSQNGLTDARTNHSITKRSLFLTQVSSWKSDFCAQTCFFLFDGAKFPSSSVCESEVRCSGNDNQANNTSNNWNDGWSEPSFEKPLQDTVFQWKITLSLGVLSCQRNISRYFSVWCVPKYWRKNHCRLSLPCPERKMSIKLDARTGVSSYSRDWSIGTLSSKVSVRVTGFWFPVASLLRSKP